MIHVFADHIHAGTLAKETGKAYYIFTYHPEVDQAQSVSLTMPVRLKSYASPVGSLHPIFDMNLPEGFLRNYAMGQKISEQWERGLLT